MKFVEALSKEAAIAILLELCEDADVAKRVSAMAQASLSVVDASVVADEVFESLNSIQVEVLWDNSGKPRRFKQYMTTFSWTARRTSKLHNISI